jgi:apolipoprotein N-acyltransferase
VSNYFWCQFFSNYFQSDFIIGLDAPEEDKVYSSAYFLKPTKEVNRYDKQILLPLAEYLPFSWLKPWVEKYGIDSFFSPGKQLQIMKGPVPFAISICRLGAELFINLTNDNWYPHSRLPQQHFSLARLRAVENGIPLIRACNSGVTAIVDSCGLTVARLFDPVGVLIAECPLFSYPTLFSYTGNWGIISLCSFFCFSFLLRKIFKREREVYTQCDSKIG